jgi:ABC-2 type transport system permease protein
MNPAPTLHPPPRVGANLRHAFGGVWRLTFRRFLLPAHGLTLVAGLAVLWLLLMAGMQPRHEPLNYVRWCVGFYVGFLVPLLAFISGAGAMRDELKSSTLDYVLIRPLPRPAFVLFKFVAHALCTQLDFLVAFAVLQAAAYALKVPAPVAAAPALLLTQVLVIFAFSAFGFLSGALTSRYVVIGLAYAGIIEVGVGQIPTQLSQLSMTHQIRASLAYLTDPGAAASAPSLLATSGWLLAFAVVMLAATAVVFTVREFAGTADS